MSERRLMGVRQAGALRGIAYAEMLRLMHSGSLPFIQLPGRRSYLIDMADLDALIDASKSGTVPGTEAQAKPVKVVENVAPKRRCRKPKTETVKAAPYQWMQQYARK